MIKTYKCRSEMLIEVDSLFQALGNDLIVGEVKAIRGYAYFDVFLTIENIEYSRLSEIINNIDDSHVMAESLEELTRT